jgi:hypothetical protein
LYEKDPIRKLWELSEGFTPSYLFHERKVFYVGTHASIIMVGRERFELPKS